MPTAAFLLALLLLGALIAEGILRAHERFLERRHLAELERLAALPSEPIDTDASGEDAA